MITPYRSVFDEVFDVAVYGSGYAAVAAARALTQQGRRVLLLSERFDLLWESGRAFATCAGDLDAPLWQSFLAELAERNWYRDGLIDCAGAEIAICSQLRGGQMRVLLSAHVIRLHGEHGLFTSAVVATKAGERTVRALQWVDASEQGTLLRIAGAAGSGGASVAERGDILGNGADGGDAQQRSGGGCGSAPLARSASAYQYRVLLRGAGVAGLSLPAAVAAEAWLEPRLWSGEVTLCIRSDKPLSLTELNARAVRLCPPSGEDGAALSVLQFSNVPLPVYAATAASGYAASDAAGGRAGLPQQCTRIANIVSASPAFASVAVQTLADRFALGLAAAAKTLAAVPLSAAGGVSGSAVAGSGVCLPEQSLECDVLVVGAGSAGPLAALSAAQAGARVIVLDASPAAGGIGAGGFIFSYFHGQPGGLFEQYDEKISAHKKTLDPSANALIGSRHPDAKKIIFEQSFNAESNLTFIGNALAYAVEAEQGRVRSVSAVSSGQRYRIAARSVIDATGDGDIAALAGALFEHGRPGDGLPLSYSQACLRVVDFGEGEGPVVRGTNFDAGWVDATDPEDLTRARITGIAQYASEAACDTGYILQLAPVMGLRQSRHIIAEQTLTLDDLISHSRFDNAIGWACSPLDTHSVDFEFESDEFLFWLWGCKHFRGIGYSQIPYGALIPKGLRNVWVACRALGVSVTAAYAVRMIRDMQRLGEAAGLAAAAAAELGCDALSVPQERWQTALQASGALDDCRASDNWQDNVLEQLDGAEPAGYLWTIYRNRPLYEAEVLLRLDSANPHVSWLAAVVLAMWADARAEPRLLAAIAAREEGLPTPRKALGPFMQWIDVPNWFLAVNLLRLCGTASALPVLLELVRTQDLVFNLRTSIAITMAALGRRIGAEHSQSAAAIIGTLAASPAEDAFVRPSRSIYRSLRGEPQLPLPQEPGSVDTREDHSWQLDLVLLRAAQAWQLPSPVDASRWLADERALVRLALQNALAG